MAAVTIQIQAGGQVAGGTKQIAASPDLVDFISALRTILFPWDATRGPDTRSDTDIANLWCNKVFDDAKTLTKRYRQMQKIASLTTPDIILT